MDTQQRMLIEWECTRLINAFAYHIDHREYDELAALFVSEGVFNRLGQKLRGRGDIVAAMRKRDESRFTRHICANIHFKTTDRDTAKATVYSRAIDSLVTESGPSIYRSSQTALVDFEDVYTRTTEGWRIAERTTRIVMVPDNSPYWELTRSGAIS